MPPEGSNSRSPQITPSLQFSTSSASNSSPKLGKGTRRMKFPAAKKLLPLLVFILSCLSILRLLKIFITTSNSTSPADALSSSLEQAVPWGQHKSSANATLLTPKEFQLLSNLITSKAPCNLLVFGLQHQYLNLASINAGGITLFLEDDPYKIREIKASSSNGTWVFKVKYKEPANKAYTLLKHARRNPACAPNTSLLQQSSCKLALRNLPKEIYQIKWDIVVVDGPIGDAPEAPGRMSTIYTAGMLARAGEKTHVVVHDVHRTIEKWFSWEFLCEENLVSSKGKFWNFRISGQSESTGFCSSETVRIE